MLHLELKISMKTQLSVIYVHVVEVCRPGYIRTYVRLPIQQMITKFHETAVNNSEGVGNSPDPFRKGVLYNPRSISAAT